MNLVSQLQAGDALLYSGKGLYGCLIRLKTWHSVGHVEVYLGLGLSTASRDGVGVGLYPVRETDLAYVWRPQMPFNASRAFAYASKRKGEPYGWLDLLAFIGWKSDGEGTVCSPYATDVQRAGGVDPFNWEPSRNIAPFQWLTSPAGDIYEVKDGEFTRRGVPVAPEASGSDSSGG